MFRRKLFKHRGFAINMLACSAFLCLAVFGWNLPGEELLGYFLIAVACLVILIGLAFVAGFLLRKIMNRKD